MRKINFVKPGVFVMMLLAGAIIPGKAQSLDSIQRIARERGLGPGPIISQPIGVNVDGQIVGMSIQPMIVNNQIYVPMRDLFSRLGASVDWDPALRTAIVNNADRNIIISANESTALVNGRRVRLTAPARYINGWVYVPMEVVSNALGNGSAIVWVPQNRVLDITTPNQMLAQNNVAPYTGPINPSAPLPGVPEAPAGPMGNG
jgi:hypothetical protein